MKTAQFFKRVPIILCAIVPFAVWCEDLTGPGGPAATALIGVGSFIDDVGLFRYLLWQHIGLLLRGFVCLAGLWFLLEALPSESGKNKNDVRAGLGDSGTLPNRITLFECTENISGMR